MTPGSSFDTLICSSAFYDTDIVWKEGNVKPSFRSCTLRSSVDVSSTTHVI